MSVTDYTPTDGHVRICYVGMHPSLVMPGTWHEERLREIDRYLVAAKAAAWAEGFDAGERDVFGHETFDEPCIPNPYLTEAPEVS